MQGLPFASQFLTPRHLCVRLLIPDLEIRPVDVLRACDEFRGRGHGDDGSQCDGVGVDSPPYRVLRRANENRMLIASPLASGDQVVQRDRQIMREMRNLGQEREQQHEAVLRVRIVPAR